MHMCLNISTGNFPSLPTEFKVDRVSYILLPSPFELLGGFPLRRILAISIDVIYE